MVKYYAVKVGRVPGIYTTWPEAQAQVNGFPGPIFKSFGTLQEAQAFLGQGSAQSYTPTMSSLPTIQAPASYQQPMTTAMPYQAPNPPTMSYQQPITSTMSYQQPITTAMSYQQPTMSYQQPTVPYQPSTSTMSSSKYYVVKKGRVPGIYRTWPDTQAQVVSFPGAIFKSFTSLEEASAFLNAGDEQKIPEGTPYVVAYTDGSFVGFPVPTGGSAAILLSSGRKFNVLAKVNDANPTNQIAELYAVYLALSNVPKEYAVKIYSDSSYAITTLTGYAHTYARENWAGGQANLSYIKACYDLMQGRLVELIHVKSHSGVRFNEEVDGLADQARNLPDYNVVMYEDQNYRGE